MAFKKPTPKQVSEAARDLARDNISDSRRSQAGKILANHKKIEENTVRKVVPSKKK